MDFGAQQMSGLTQHCMTPILEGAWPGLGQNKLFQTMKYWTVSQTFNCMMPFRVPGLLAKVRTSFWEGILL